MADTGESPFARRGFVVYGGEEGEERERGREGRGAERGGGGRGGKGRGDNSAQRGKQRRVLLHTV